ncbi:MAG: ATP-binding cassette domain-containing protein [Clostridia bacterium]|nr:ATP-binding cassette domain-containing protein [Clostridia bacterium]
MIEVKNLYLKYIREYYALFNINLTVADGETVAFVGKKNSGKTTLLRVIAGLEKFDEGEVYIDGRDIKKIDFSIDTNLGYLPEKPVFFDNKSVYDNLKYVLKVRKQKKNDIESTLNKALIDFNIEKYKNIKASDLDLYEKYLISFVRLSLRKLDYLLIDNIFDKLEAEDAEALIVLIDELFVKKGITTIIACENFEPLQNVCTRKINFDAGSVVETKNE